MRRETGIDMSFMRACKYVCVYVRHVCYACRYVWMMYVGCMYPFVLCVSDARTGTYMSLFLYGCVRICVYRTFCFAAV